MVIRENLPVGTHDESRSETPPDLIARAGRWRPEKSPKELVIQERERVGLELRILAPNPGFGKVARGPTSVLR